MEMVIGTRPFLAPPDRANFCGRPDFSDYRFRLKLLSLPFRVTQGRVRVFLIEQKSHNRTENKELHEGDRDP
jgi:hypothetical protein